MPSLLEQELVRQSVDVQSIQLVKRIVKRETEDEDAGNINPTTPQGILNETAWVMSYTDIEKVLLAMLKLYNIDVDAGYDDTGNHRSHISEFDNADNLLHGIFGCVRVEEAGNSTLQFASHKKLKKHVKSNHSNQSLPPNPTQVQEARAGIHEAQIRVVAAAQEAQEDKTPSLSSHRLRDSHEAPIQSISYPAIIVDALAETQSAHDDVLRKQAEAKKEVEAVTRERDELKEQLAQAGKEQAALIAQARIEGAEEMFRRISGAGEWLLLSFKGKIGEEEKAPKAIS
ncbi:MAG: hypothetical protein Q9208_000015 [Pyrenodesmia sp. 3 TL-2023]